MNEQRIVIGENEKNIYVCITTRMLWIVLLMCCTISPLWGQLSKEFFGIRPEDRRFLRYNIVQNEFDNAAITYIYGEFVVSMGGVSKRVNLEYLPTQTTKTGSTMQGEDAILMAVGKTEPFEITSPIVEIEFYREMAVSSTPCDPEPNGGSNNGGGSTGGAHPYDGYWKIGVGAVLDQTEFVLQLVRESDGSVVATFDSVGTLANPTTSVVPYYGTEPNNLSPHRSINISSTLMGELFSIRLLPRRYGTTPLGLRMRQFPSYFNWSAAFQRDTLGGFFLSPSSERDSSNRRYFLELLTYCDSVKNATGLLPAGIAGMPLLTREQKQIYFSRYFNERMTNGVVHYEEKGATFPTPYSKTSYPVPSVEGHSVTLEGSSLSLVAIRPHPVTETSFDIDVQCFSVQEPVRVHLRPLHGGISKVVWEGVLDKGQRSMTIHRDGIAAGVYYLEVHNIKDEPVSSMLVVLK